MKRISLPLTLLFLLPGFARAQDISVKQTLTYLQKLQTESGGFKATLDSKADTKVLPTLRATSTAIRAFHYWGGDLPNKAACVKFVESCHDAASGGFADTPAAKPDVFTTAVGVMAVTELNLPTAKYAGGAIRYLSENAKGFEEIRIAAAGLERLNAKGPKNATWLEEVVKMRNQDGTYGKGPGQGRATGSSVVTVLRLGGKIANDPAMAERTNVLKALNEAQRQNGGWGKADDEIASDLETTYRVMRCYHMLQAKPASVEGVRSFVAKCRNSDGGYAVAPGQPSSVSGTYFAAIVLHWLKEK